jgi:hypothetical protein
MAKLVAQGVPDLRGTPLARVVTLLASSASYAGVEPYTFCVWAWPPKLWRERPPQDSLQRSFRFEFEGCWSHLTLFGRNSAWRRETAQRLIRAGYERWLSLEDQVDLRRWLRGKQERLRELAFLRDLGNRAAPMRWPRRRPVVRPVAVQHGHWSRALWWSVIREVAEAGIRWNAGTMQPSACLELVP